MAFVHTNKQGLFEGFLPFLLPLPDAEGLCVLCQQASRFFLLFFPPAVKQANMIQQVGSGKQREGACWRNEKEDWGWRKWTLVIVRGQKENWIKERKREEWDDKLNFHQTVLIFSPIQIEKIFLGFLVLYSVVLQGFFISSPVLSWFYSSSSVFSVVLQQFLCDSFTVPMWFLGVALKLLLRGLCRSKVAFWMGSEMSSQRQN